MAERTAPAVSPYKNKLPGAFVIPLKSAKNKFGKFSNKKKDLPFLVEDGIHFYVCAGSAQHHFLIEKFSRCRVYEALSLIFHLSDVIRQSHF